MMASLRKADLEAAIERARGGMAALWEYAASLSELSIRITWQGRSENLHLVCNGCTRLEATAAWGNVDFEWRQADSGEIILIDAKARLLLVCKQIRVFPNLAPIF